MKNYQEGNLPRHKIKVRRPIQAQWITIEQIRNKRVVSICRILISHQFRVLPDPNHIWEEEDSGVFVDCLSAWLGNVGFDVADFEGFAGWCSAVGF